ncbi:MAG TPA: hypothetical protein VHE34_08665 [Puia sp.]|uniref:hypothetical protein n=1 Tax=Puia sp. TaxID=2045100 RepID=UPI002B763124|nr:hypothetical protein [Puia sp.]HVU95282.1 hypothetical protein [Puia sp.]
MAIPAFKLTLRQLSILLLLFPLSCKDAHSIPSVAMIRELQLKEGKLISCGPPEKEFGTVVFAISTPTEAAAFNQGMALLHSFEYDEAEKVFAGIIAREPACAMAYWGVAMSNFHPLWAPPTVAELKKGSRALAIAAGINGVTPRERDYIRAMQAFYGEWEKVENAKRCLRWEQAMDTLYHAYPDDKEAVILYTLALTAAADPADKGRSKQRKAGAILTNLYRQMPDHPGIIHYIIHTYDYPELAELALPVAKRYAEVAPSSAHALHMPSHIFTRLGLWDEDIRSNLVSVDAAKCYAQAAGIRGHWDEELHGLDYLVYAYLQRGQDSLALQLRDYLATIDTVYPLNFKVAYAFAAIPVRYVLERRDWAAAARLTVQRDPEPRAGSGAGLAAGSALRQDADPGGSLAVGPKGFPWKDYPWQEAIVHFARGLGAAHTGRLDSAAAELAALGRIHDRLLAGKDAYKAGQVQIQQKAVEAWMAFSAGRVRDAVAAMLMAADLEDSTEKHPVTPCEMIPARELLADLLLAAERPGEALRQYEADLRGHPRRFNGVYGAGLAAWKAGDKEKAKGYFRALITIADTVGCNREELRQARTILGQS